MLSNFNDIKTAPVGVFDQFKGSIEPIAIEFEHSVVIFNCKNTIFYPIDITDNIKLIGFLMQQLIICQQNKTGKILNITITVKTPVFIEDYLANFACEKG